MGLRKRHRRSLHYIERFLRRFAHAMPQHPERAPHEWAKPNYGAKVQYADTTDPNDTEVGQAEQQLIQEVVGVLLFYGRAIDSSILVALEVPSPANKPVQPRKP